MKRFALQSIIILCVFMLGNITKISVAQAQEFNLYSSDDIYIESVPQIPGPNEKVKLTLKSYSFNLNNFNIIWFENGERKSSGYGNKEFNFTTGNSGESVDITGVVEIGNQVLRKELRFTPSEVDLLWEAIDAYTPPFYKGKALPLQQAQIKITAIPQTKIINPTDAPKLVYYWENNYQAVSNASGFGKQSYTFNVNPLNTNEKISVTVNDRQENSFAKNTLDIPTNTFKPEILFYETDNNGRVLTNRALNNFPTIYGDTVKLSFHPLFISSSKKNFVDNYIGWEINDQSTPPQDFAHQNELYITSDGESGSAKIGVNVENIENILQQVSQSISLIFIN